MTEKRYTHNILGSVFKDGEVFALTEGECQAITLCIELNELNDKCDFLEIENEALEDGATKYAELYHKILKENEQLKQFKEQHIEEYLKLKTVSNELKKENEQLKKENKFLRCTIESNSQDDYIDYLEKQNERLKERITELASNDKIVFMNGQY